jgi:crotonobetaine/carnitine-CoA ligase
LPLIAVPPNPQREYHSQGYEVTYAAAGAAGEALAALYRAAGYGLGHRVGLFLDNRPDHLLHKLALNSIGACCVPMNPEYRASELAYLIDHARVDLVVVLASRRAALDAALAQTREQPAVAGVEAFDTSLSAPPRSAIGGCVEATTPASILYTSGTTGRPKGCVLSHRYELAAGAWYASRGHLAQVRPARERLYNPLPLFHVNASVLSSFCMLLSGGCQVQAERFQPSRWWTEIRESRATIVHYLGVIVSMLLKQPDDQRDRAHDVRFGTIRVSARRDLGHDRDRAPAGG